MSMIEFILIVAVVVGFFHGFFDDKPSFWRGFGNGLASKDTGDMKTSFYYIDRKTGIGMKIDPPKEKI